MIVNEIYIGRIPEVDDIFKCFSELRDNYSQMNAGQKARKIAELEKKIEDFWGFKAFSIKIYDSQWANAYTYPVANSFDVDPDSMFVTTSKGYKFKKEAKIACMAYITSAVLNNKNITNEEAFAVFLHEVGHSFVQRSPLVKAQFEAFKNACISEIITYSILTCTIGLAPIALPALLQDIRLMSNIGKRFSANCKKFKDKIPILRSVSVSDMFKKLDEWTNINLYISNTKSGTTLERIDANRKYVEKNKNKIFAKGNPYAYDRSLERLSDDFANIYGFGPYLATGLIKMDNSENNPEKIYKMHEDPEFKDIFDKTEALSKELYDVLGAHPGTVDRIYAMTESLEYEIKNNKKLSPKIKAELQSNLKQLKSVINDLKKTSGEISKNKNDYMKALMAVNAKQGNSEDKYEKKYFDRSKVNKDYNDRLVDESYDFMDEMDMDELEFGIY